MTTAKHNNAREITDNENNPKGNSGIGVQKIPVINVPANRGKKKE